MRAIYYGWIIVGLAILANTIVYGTTYHAFGLFVVPVSSEYGLSRANMNTAFVILEFGTAAASPVMGRLLDHVPVKRIMMGSVLLMGMGFAVLGLTNSLWVSAAAIFLPLAVGILGAAALSTSLLIARWFTAQRGRAMALAALGVSLGSVIVAPIVSVLIQAVGWRSALLIIAASVTILLLIVALCLRERPGEDEVEPGSQPSVFPTPAMGGTSVAKPLDIDTVLRLPDFWASSIAIALASSVAQTLIITLVPLAADRRLSAIEAASLVSMFGASAIGCKLLLAVVADKIDRIYLLAGICFLGAIANAGFYVSEGYMLHAACALTAGAASGMLGPVFNAFLADRFGVQSYGTLRGLSGPVIAIIGAVGVRFAGEVYDRTGNYDLLFATFIAIDMTATLLMLSLRFTKPPLIRLGAAQT